jgi:hypothetical protein
MPMTFAMAIDGSFSPHTDRGVSSEAAVVRRQIKELRDHMTVTETLGKSYRETRSSLLEIYKDTLTENWNGYEAKATMEADLFTALRFLDTLPMSIPRPEVSVDPDGEFAFEWYNGPRNVLSVSIGQLGRISYAAHIGRKRYHGTEYFSDELAACIIENLEKIFS